MELIRRCPEPEVLSLYALGALGPEEKHDVDHHLHKCDACQVKASDLLDVAGLITLTAPLASPPPDLKAKVLAGTYQPTRAAGWASRFRIAMGITAAAAVMVLGLKVYDGMRPSPYYKAITQAVSDAKRQGARVVSLQGTESAPKARGELYLVDGTGATRRVVIVVEGLQVPGGSQVYCLWLLKNGERRMGGWLTVDQSGRGGLVFETTSAFDAVGVTLEPTADYDYGPDGYLMPKGPKVLGVPKN